MHKEKKKKTTKRKKPTGKKKKSQLGYQRQNSSLGNAAAQSHHSALCTSNTLDIPGLRRDLLEAATVQFSSGENEARIETEPWGKVLAYSSRFTGFTGRMYYYIHLPKS